MALTKVSGNLIQEDNFTIGVVTATNATFTNATVTDTLNVGIITGASSITATSYFGDGSTLSNIVGTGAGVTVFDSGDPRGTPGSINFSTNLDVTVSSGGIVTVTVSPSFTEDFSIGTGATTAFFDVSEGRVGIGSTQPTVTLDVIGDLKVTGNIDFGSGNSSGSDFVIDGNTGIQTDSVSTPDLVGAGNSFVGLYIGDGFLAFSTSLNRPGGYYITTSINALNAGPVSLGSTMKLDGTWVII